MTAILIIYACIIGTDDCRHIAGQQTSLSECLAMSQAVGAAWANVNPGMELKGIICADPKDMHKYFGWDI